MQPRGRHPGPAGRLPGRRGDPGVVRACSRRSPTCWPAWAGATAPTQVAEAAAAVAGAGFASLEHRPHHRRRRRDRRRLGAEPRRRARPGPSRRPTSAPTPSPSSRAPRWPPTRTAIPTTTSRPRRYELADAGAGGRPATGGRRSPTGPVPATSAATTASTGPRATTGASARPPTPTGPGAGGGTSAPPTATWPLVARRPADHRGRGGPHRRAAAVRGAGPGPAHAGRGARPAPCPTTPTSTGWSNGPTGRAVLTVRGRLLANEVTARLQVDAGRPSAGPGPRAPAGIHAALCLTEPTDAPTTRRPTARSDLMEKVVNLCKRRGFIFPSAEIYGGFRSTYDYGPLGVNLLRNVKNAWWRGHGPAPRRRGRPRRRHPVAARRSGRPRATWPTSPTPWSTAGTATSAGGPDKIDGVCPNCGSTDLTEARAFNLMFKTYAGPVEDEGTVAYLRPETAQGMFVNFAQRAPDHPQEAALRHRPGGQVVPQRDHPAELRLPHPRVRADGDGVLRPPGRGRPVVRLLARRAVRAGTSTSASPADEAAAAPPRRRRALALLGGHRRRGVPLPLGLGRARGHRQPHRLRPEGPRRGVGGAARVLRPGHRRALRALRHRAGGRRHPDHDGLPPGRLRRGRGRRRGPHRAAARTPGWPPTRWRCCPCRRRTTLEPLAREVLASLQPHLHVRLRRDPVHRPALPAPGRGGHARGA